MSEHDNFEDSMIGVLKHIAAAIEEQARLNEMLVDIILRLDRLEQHFSEQGLNDLAHAIELRVISRLRYGGNPRIELPRHAPAERK